MLRQPRRPRPLRQTRSTEKSPVRADWQFSHVGVITAEPKPGEVFIEATRVWITN